MIKSVYLLQQREVIVFDKEGEHLHQYDGKFQLVRDTVLADCAPDAEFYITRWGQGNFEKVTREDWRNYEPE